jgi:hypothetical protein
MTRSMVKRFMMAPRGSYDGAGRRRYDALSMKWSVFDQSPASAGRSEETGAPYATVCVWALALLAQAFGLQARAASA